MARDGEKPDLGADAINVSTRAQARGRIPGEHAGEIDDWDFPLHCFHSGFAMVFALLIAAIIWNLGTWWLGLPASSSHTLIGSIIGVGVANALMRGMDGTSGVDWTKATEIGYSLLLSPLFGFCMAAALLLALKLIVRNPELYSEPKGSAPPPWWIRGILILTCTGVSFGHGSNDGQKGMGLIMLILIGTVPMAYALNRTPAPSHVTEFKTSSEGAAKVIESKAAGHSVLGNPRPAVSEDKRRNVSLACRASARDFQAG